MKKLETHPSSQSGSWLRRLVREPLVPFQVLSIVATFQRTWLRLPTHEELASRVEDRIKEEILYWEALALGLDRSVTV